MKTALTARLTCTFDARPLAVVDGLPGDGAELRPAQMRALATALLQVANDCEARKLFHRGKLLPADCRTYPLGVAP